MGGKRTNQFNLMLTESELKKLKKQADERGFVNKSQYLRDLVKHDAEGESVSGSTMMGKIEEVASNMQSSLKLSSILIIVSSLALLALAVLIYLNI